MGEAPEPLSDEWCADHFDHLSPALGPKLHETMAHMRAHHPVARSEAWGGFWLLSRYADVLSAAQDWGSFSSEHGITVPTGPTSVPAIPEQLDPPLHREYKRLINAWFTPALVGRQEDATRALVTRLIDDVVETVACDFMESFARPLPGRVFFEMVLHAPAAELAAVNRLATLASMTTDPGSREARKQMLAWIDAFVDTRLGEPRRDDVVDAVLHAEIEGRPITRTEIVGVLQLLLFGGLDTTAGALGMMMVRFCREPGIAALLRDQPERIPGAIEELLRLDGPFVCIARTATRDTEVGGCPVQAGDKVLISWASANRDESEFGDPDLFDADRTVNRHLAFGAGPHRCAGSHLARMNLRIALEELLRRLDDLRLAPGAEPIRYHSAFSRTPAAVPIEFTPGGREAVGVATAS